MWELRTLWLCWVMYVLLLFYLPSLYAAFNNHVILQAASGVDSTKADTTCALQIEDLKSYFDHEEINQEVDGDSPEQFTDGNSPPMLTSDRTAPRSRQDLLDLLPPKHIADRLVMRYFSAYSASQRTQDTRPHHYLPSWSKRRALTAEVDRHCPQANLRQIGMFDPPCPRLVARDSLQGMGIWDESSRC